MPLKRLLPVSTVLISAKLFSVCLILGCLSAGVSHAGEEPLTGSGLFKAILKNEMANIKIEEADVINANMVAIASPIIYISHSISIQSSDQTLDSKAIRITSIPTLEVTQGEQYEYQLLVSSIKQQRYQVGLIQAPEGMFITSAGYIGWHPSTEQIGQNIVRFFVEDVLGERQVQEFVVDVVARKKKS